jgi:hypothetical protein
MDAALVTAVSPIGMPTLTFPYLLTMWLFMLPKLLSKLVGWVAGRPALCYDLCAREEADAVLAVLVEVAES